MNDHGVNCTILVPDIQISEMFLNAFGIAGLPQCFQTFDDGLRKDCSLARTFHGTAENLHTTLFDFNKRGAGVFWAPARVRPGARRTSQNVSAVRTFFADGDDPAHQGEIEDKVARSGLVPAAVVETSPGKRHYYWNAECCPVHEFKRVQQHIAAALGTDSSVCDPPRVMRLPGFIHRKSAPFRVHCIHLNRNAPAYTPIAILKALPASPHQWRQRINQHRTTRSTDAGGVVTSPQAQRLRRWLEATGGLFALAIPAAMAETPHGERHLLLRAIAARLVAARWTDADACALVLPAAARVWHDVEPGELQERVARLTAWMRNQEATKLASTPASSDRVTRLAAAFGADRRAPA